MYNVHILNLEIHKSKNNYLNYENCYVNSKNVMESKNNISILELVM